MFSSLMLLTAEANGVIALLMMKLMRGGRSARREANLMVSEKNGVKARTPSENSREGPASHSGYCQKSESPSALGCGRLG